MDNEALLASYERFGVSPDASIREVELAFYKLRKLYNENSLATYSLMGKSDRQEQLASLQKSYDLILQSRLHTQSTPDDSAIIAKQEEQVAKESKVVVVDADPMQSPGIYLKQMREARGLSLQRVAEHTKIGAYQLQCIEEQNFAALPAPVYLRGFLKEYCRMVKTPDIESVIDSFIGLYKDELGD